MIRNRRSRQWFGLLVIVTIVGVAIVVWFGRRGPTTHSETAAEHEPESKRKYESRRSDVNDAMQASISGTVVDRELRPLEKVTVCSRFSSVTVSTERAIKPACTMTSGDGAYRLMNLVAGEHWVSAHKRGYLPGAYRTQREPLRLRLHSREHRTGARIVLTRGGVELNGIVKDIGGGVVSEALVRVDSTGWGSAVGSTIVTASDTGRFVAWAKPGVVRVTAMAAGYVDGSTRAVAPGTFVTVFLTPESGIAGTVVLAQTKQPVAGARVSAGDVHALTDSAGQFRINQLSPGRYKPIARASDLHGQAKYSLRLGLGETRTGVVISVHPVASIRARVLIKGNDEPCLDGRVRLKEPLRSERLEGVVAAQGVVKFGGGLLPGHYRVSVWCEGYASQDSYESLPVGAEAIDVVWHVIPGAELRGVVFGPGDIPVADATVVAQAVMGRSTKPRFPIVGRTDATGEFTLGGLIEGRYAVSATADALYGPAESPKIDITRGGDEQITLRLSAGGQVHGNVLDETGRPVANALVEAYGESANRKALTRDDGSFEMAGVRPGRYRVVARLSSSGALRRPGTTDDDALGERAVVKDGDTVRVTLRVESQVGTIRGRVVDSDGSPVTDAYVMAQRESDATGASKGAARYSIRWGEWRKQPALTDTEGNFEVRRLSPGTYMVVAYRRGGGEAFAEGVAVNATVTLAIRPTGTISGRVTTAAGAAPLMFKIRVAARESGLSRTESFLRTDGEFSMAELPAGNFEVIATASEGTATTRVLLTPGDKPADVSLTVVARVAVRGTLVDLDTGEPVANMRVGIFAASSNESLSRYGASDAGRQHISRTGGGFVVENAPSGRVLLKVSPVEPNGASYDSQSRLLTVGRADPFDVGQVRLVRRRTEASARGGDLGFVLQHYKPGVAREQQTLVVASIRADGPAADSGLEVDDRIVAVDGHSVVGANSLMYRSLTTVKVGATVTLTVARGVKVRITAGPQPK